MLKASYAGSLTGIVRRHGAMKVLLTVLILAEIFLVVLVLTPVFVDRRDLARAVAAHFQNPSQDNLRELEHQQSITRQIAFCDKSTVAVLLVANSCGLVFVSRRLRHVQIAA